MYPIGELEEEEMKKKECLLCGEDVIPGTGTCTLQCDVECDEFNADVWDTYHGEYRGHWSGRCRRCWEEFTSGEKESDEPDFDDCGVCYEGKHVFTEEEKDAVLLSLEEKN